MMISKSAILKIIAPSAYVKQKKNFRTKSPDFGDILHNPRPHLRLNLDPLIKIFLLHRVKPFFLGKATNANNVAPELNA